MSKQPLMIDVDRGMYIGIPRWKSREQIKKMEKQWKSDPRMRLFFRGVRGRKAFFEFVDSAHRDKIQNSIAKLIQQGGNEVAFTSI